MKTITRKRTHKGFIKYETYLRRKRIKRFLATVWEYILIFLSALSLFALLFAMYILLIILM